MSTEERRTDPEGLLVRPGDPTGTGVLVIAGSSGALEADRARLLAAHGATALTIRWFGGPGQQPASFEVPLETFTSELDRLSAECDRIAMLGTSFGAEAALLVATLDPRVDVVVACAPTSVVWAGVDEGRQTSHWTWRGEPLSFVPFDEAWEPDADPPAFRGLYESSLAAAPDEATIPVERITGEVLLIAGEDDRVWPSVLFARQIAARRENAGLATRVATGPGAGHRILLPGEVPAERGRAMARGGTPEADAALGRAAWPYLVDLLRLRPHTDSSR